MAAAILEAPSADRRAQALVAGLRARRFVRLRDAYLGRLIAL